MENLIDKARKIKLVGTDIDGVWTDAKMYYTEKGDFMKAFSTYDGMAIQILKDLKIPVVILTSEKTNIVLERAKKLGIDEVYINEKEKLNRMFQICKKLQISMDQVAYIGDDLNDLQLLEKVGLSAMPSSSPILNMFSPDYLTQKSGGKGAFREFIDYIIQAKNIS